MSYGCGVGEGPLRDDGDVVAVQGEDAEVLEAPEGVLLDALELVVGDDQGSEPGEVGEDEGRQDGDLIVAQVSVKEEKFELLLKMTQT